MNEIGKVSVGVYLNKQKFNQEVNKLPSEVNAVGTKLTNAFSKIGKTIAAAFSVKAVTNFTKKLVETTAQINAANSQFAQTFGDLSDSAIAAMKRVADESGIVQTRLQGVGTSIYAFAKTTGMDSVSALNMMEEALQVTADSAAYYDRSLEDVSESLKSFLKGNYANDAALGLSCTETTRNAAANQLFGKSFRDLSEAQKQLTLLQMVKDANAASGALGQAAREADGLENVVGNLKEAWNRLLGVIGKPVLNGAVAVIQRITAWLQRMTTVAKAAVSALSDLFGWKTEDDSAAAAQATSDAIGGAVDNETALSAAVKKTNDEVKRGLASFDRLNVISESKSSSSDDDSDSGGIDNPLASSFGDTIGASVDLDTDDASAKIEELKGKFKKLLQPVVDFYNQHIKPIYDKVKPAVERIGDKFKRVLNEIDLEPLKKSVGFIFDKIDKIVDSLLPDIEDSIGTYIKPVLKDIAELILPTIFKWVGYIIGFITPILHSLYTILKPIWENIIQPAFHKIADWFEKITDKVGPKLEKLGQKIGSMIVKWEPIIRKISEVLGPVISKIIDLLGGSLGSALEAGLDSLGKIIDAIGGYADIIVGITEGDGEKILGGFRTLDEGIFELLVAPFKHIRAAISGAFEGVGIDIEGFLPGIWSKISSFFSGIGEWFSTLWSSIVRSWHTVFDPWAKIFVRAKDWVNTTVFQPIVTKINEIYSKISQGASQAWTGIKNVFSPVADWFENVFSRAWRKVQDVFSTGGRIFNNIKEGIVNAFKNVVNHIISGINMVIANTFAGLNKALTGIHDIEILGVKPFTWISPIAVPQIPKLAKGGIATAPALALVGDNSGAGSGDPEVISPLSKLKSMMNGSNEADTQLLTSILDYMKRLYELFIIFRNNGGGNYQFIAQLDGETIFNEFVDRIHLYQQRHRGELPW